MTLLQWASSLKYTPKEATLCCLCDRGKQCTPCWVPQPTFTPIFIYITRPSCTPLIGFAWVMSTIDTKYNLIRSREQRCRDGRYWNRTGMAINVTTPSQCSIIAIWFINYPWWWGFYLTRHANWQKRHTHTCTRIHTKEGNIWYHGEACLPSAWCRAVWRDLRQVYLNEHLKERMTDSVVKSKHTHATKQGWPQMLPWLDISFF